MKIAVLLTLARFALVQSNPLSDDSRMVGGIVAHPNAYPYMVSLRTGYNDQHYCSGVIISPKTIITAGHCIDWLPARSIEVVVGINKLESEDGSKYRVARTLLHPNYNNQDYKNDIGLVYVAKKINFGSTIQPIVPEWDLLSGSVSVMTIGWGSRLENDGSSTTELRYNNEFTLIQSDCKTMLTGPFPTVEENELCIISPPGVGVCTSDAGGPVVYKGRLVGIIKSRVHCGATYPDVTMRISSYKSWIEKNTIQ